MPFKMLQSILSCFHLLVYKNTRLVSNLPNTSTQNTLHVSKNSSVWMTESSPHHSPWATCLCRILKITQWWGMMLRWWWSGRGGRKSEKQQWLENLGGLRGESSKQVAGKWDGKRTGERWFYKVQGGQLSITMVGHQHCTRSFGSSKLIKRDCVTSQSSSAPPAFQRELLWAHPS